MNSKIAFFDSGIGGLSVLHHARKILPNKRFIFFADEKNLPYGTKSPNEILSCVDEAFNFLISQEVSAIVIACNTATSVAIETMRKKYSLPIIGMEPAIKLALKSFPKKKILVIATNVTVTSTRILNLVDKLSAREFVELRALPKLVEFAEKQEFNSTEVENYLREEFMTYNLEDFASIVLGCTHFNYFKDTIKKIVPNAKILDGNKGTVNELIKRAKLRTDETTASVAEVDFFYSGIRITDKNELERLGKYFKRLDEMYLE